MAGRPRSFDREQALEVARDAFWRSGYEQTSISALTGAMRINPPSLYAAFGGKARLFEQASDLYVQSLRRGLAEALAEPTAREAIAEVLRRAAVAHCAPGTPPGCFVLSEPRLDGERAHMREQLAGRIRRGQAEGDVAAAVDADALSSYLEAVLIGMSSRARDGADQAELEATARLAAAVLG